MRFPRCGYGIQPLLQSETPNHIFKGLTSFTSYHCLSLAQKPIADRFPNE